jgi:hypothetical protein
MIELAPRRGLDGYKYFVARSGAPTSLTSTNRREEQLAMALVNDATALTIGDEIVALIMYAFPLYTRGGPKGIRGVDVVGHSLGTDRFWIIELKAAGTGRGDSPLRALCEALTYAAVIEANHEHIAGELATQLDLRLPGTRPGVVVAAPTGYWERWKPNARTGDWWSEFRRLVDDLEAALSSPVAVLDLGDIDFETAADGRPYVTGSVATKSVSY